MHAAPDLSVWDTVVLVVPFLALLVMWMFGLDDRLSRTGARRSTRRFGMVEVGGDLYLIDPDGSLSSRTHADATGGCGNSADGVRTGEKREPQFGHVSR